MYIQVDLDWLNDYGTFIRSQSLAPTENEWLLTIGSRLLITEMSPFIMKKSEVVKMKDYFN